MLVALVGGESPKSRAARDELQAAVLRRFGSTETGKEQPRALVVLFVDDDGPDQRALILQDAVSRIAKQPLPPIVALFEGAIPPTASELLEGEAAVRTWPCVDVSSGRCGELLAVLDFLHAGSQVPVLSPAPRPLVAPERSGPPTTRGRRDPILMNISMSSGLVGLVLWSMLGFGPSSLFLFLSAVTFVLSKPNPQA